MPVEKLDHVNVRTTQLDAMVDWYTRILGMKSGYRPDFPFPGAWMYMGDDICVHLVLIDGAPATGSEAELKLEHFAFKATGRAEFEQTLKNAGEKFRCGSVPSTDIVQYNVWDPDGNHIHVDFHTGE